MGVIARNQRLVELLASTLDAKQRCIRTGNAQWKRTHGERLVRLVRDHMPSGSGFDNGTELVEDDSQPDDKLVFRTSFHHMNGFGHYDGWTEHTVKVYPSFVSGLRIDVGGRDRNGIKELIAEAFHDALMREVEPNSGALVAQEVSP